MTDPLPLCEAIRALLEADTAVSVNGLTAETKAALLDAWDAALGAACRRGDERPVGLSLDAADAAWAARGDSSLEWSLADGLDELRGYTEQAPAATMESIAALYAQLGDTRVWPSQRITAVCGQRETLDWLVGLFPRVEPMPGFIAGLTTLFAVPLRVDDDVPASTIRLEYADGSHKDTRVRMGDEQPARPKRRRFSVQCWCRKQV